MIIKINTSLKVGTNCYEKINKYLKRTKCKGYISVF